MRLVIATLVALAATLTTTPATAAPDDDPPATRAVPSGQWILAPDGRVLLLHGVNMVYKRAPYAPDRIGFGRDDARFLARNGFRTVRLGLIWKAVEPRPGRYDDRYLARIARTARILAAEGIWTMLDFHQDLYHERFQGEGAPDWAVLDRGLPAQPQLGFPYNYFAMPGLNAAFDSFWRNAEGPGGVGLQDRYARAWAHTAAYFRDVPSVLGVDLFNEPWPGTAWALCIPAGCPAFDARLERFSQRSIDAIRRVDRRTVVFYEPHVLFNNGVQTRVRPEGRRLGFSFHDYCLTAEVPVPVPGLPEVACDVFDDLVWQNTAKHVRRTGDAPLLTEFGATTDQRVLRDMVDRAEQAMTGWQYWAYCGCDDPTTTGPGATQALVLDPAKPPRGRNVDRAKLRSLVVPHLLTVAGTPQRSSYDRDARTLAASWSVRRAGGGGRFGPGSRTEISVPRRVYRQGYDVRVTGGRVVSEPGAPVLVVAQRAGADRVAVSVRPLR
jgi:endoglycosylceramidase